MARTDLERYNETYEYLRSVNTVLAQDVDQMVAANAMDKGALGGALSLKGIWKKGHVNRGQHKALRALMLCQTFYLQPPWARQEEFIRGDSPNPDGSFPTVGGQYKPYYLEWKLDVPTASIRNKSESAIKELISCYATIPTATPGDLADIAGGKVIEGESADYRTLSRTGPSRFGNMCVCYDAVRLWLFKAGFVSMKWLTHEGPSLIARTANQMLGEGVVVPPEKLESIPRGWVFNFHGGDVQGRSNKDVCHWGVSLGHGIGAATNTSDGEKGKTVVFKRGAGPARFGVFELRESYDVCNLKYPGTAVIRQIDPRTIPNLY